MSPGRAALLLAALAPAVLSAARAFAADGLLAEYADGKRRVSEVVSTPHFSLKADESIHPAVAASFSATWTGRLKILAPGKYKVVAGPASITLAGKPVGAEPVALVAGEHSLHIEYRRPAGPVRLQIAWSSDSFGPEPLPPGVLVHDAPAPAAGLAAWQQVARGRALAEDLNCRGCHGAAPQIAPRGRGPVLSNAGGRLQPAWIAKWLEDPTAYRPTARMPGMNLTATERRDVTAYLGTLLTRGSADPGSIAEPEKRKDPAALAKVGKALGEEIGCKACHADQGEGMTSLAGVGSKLSVPALRAFLLNPERVEPTGRMPSFLLKEPEAAALATALSMHKLPAFETPVAPGDAAAGKALVQQRGCLSCHTIDVGGEPLPNLHKAPALASLATLTGERGCLAAKPPAAAPRYRLSAADRSALAAYLRTPDVAYAPLHDARRAFEHHRCAACHDLGRGPLVSFTHPPPSLADVGNKLKVTWLREVLSERVRMRHWLSLRMPDFPKASSARLAEGLAALAGASREDPPAPAKPDALALRDGVRYLGRGEEGLACINCHDFAWYRSGAATPAPDMATMGRRMRPEWFRRWLLDPQRIYPGTQMPSFFTEVEQGVVDRKINAMWSALGQGRDMGVPEGVTPDDRAVKLLATSHPIAFRSFLTGGAVRSIQVGFPGGLAYSWDADACRLEMAWSGEFLDVRSVWMERGGQKAVPLGARFYVAAEGSPLRVGSATQVGKAAYRAMTLDRDGVPTWHYELEGVSVAERLSPARAGVGLERAFEVRSSGARKGTDLFYVPAEGEGVSVVVEGATPEGRGWKIPLAAGKPSRFTVTLTAQPSKK